MKFILTILLLLPCCIHGNTQGTLTDYKHAKEVHEAYRKMYDVPRQITWSADGESFFYTVRKPGGRTAHYLVNAIAREKEPIDMVEIARQMTALKSAPVRINSIQTGSGFKVVNAAEIEFAADAIKWKWNNRRKQLTRLQNTRSLNDRNVYWGAIADDSKGVFVSSPDSGYTAFLKNNNIYLHKKKDGKFEKQLTFDGSPGEYYSANILWSSDSKKIAVVKVRKAAVRQLTLIESSPPDQLQPRILTRNYPKPGDALPQYYPAVISVESGRLFSVDPHAVENQFSITNMAWSRDDSSISFEYNQRGHQHYDVLRLNAITGATRAIISETSATFIDYSGKKYRKDIEKTNEIIWASERDGWNHLYLFDSRNGQLKNQITKGHWVVRNVVAVDVDHQKIIFEASGMKNGEDPYLIRYYSIGFDGSGLTELTPERANHQGVFNGQNSLFVDVFSRVDEPPVAVLRDANDGSVLMPLEQADISELNKAGWKHPEVFSAPGRDGKTDIWGIIVRPRNFDPQKKYPVIEYIYAGPHSSFVPKSFVPDPASAIYELAELGFIVVQMDGMGTSNRSKAFQDVAWKNLKDAGFPDRIAWMKAAAKKYPYMDLSRVGIYGTSAGGQSSTGALLFHPEFYKVGVSSCGCHDNRMDKIWWNEQWMGWPIGPQYAECSNVDNAYRLQGKLMLIVGELDDNVDPSSTFQLVNALIKAGKDHEFIMVPGTGHSSGGDFGEKKRRDFFVKNLLGVQPPAWNLY
ncbi:DPP IV N-terminal domain-containing protein [Niabella hirudinis]|uniref:S9 family peptidase n=1 Tax=Niabella hirudinis TaxID=1285929 RepID=UPI003EBEE1B9